MGGVALLSGCIELFESEEAATLVVINRTGNPVNVEISAVGPDGERIFSYDDELEYSTGSPEIAEEILTGRNGDEVSVEVYLPDFGEDFEETFTMQCVGATNPDGNEQQDSFYIEIYDTDDAAFIGADDVEFHQNEC
jgi:hypothetical protein